jgi:hypothetical protein
MRPFVPDAAVAITLNWLSSYLDRGLFDTLPQIAEPSDAYRTRDSYRNDKIYSSACLASLNILLEVIHLFVIPAFEPESARYDINVIRYGTG